MKKVIDINIIVPDDAKGCHVVLGNMREYEEQFKEGNDIFESICDGGRNALEEFSKKVLGQCESDGNIPMYVTGSYSDEGMCLFEFRTMYFDDFGQSVFEYEFTGTAS